MRVIGPRVAMLVVIATIVGGCFTMPFWRSLPFDRPPQLTDVRATPLPSPPASSAAASQPAPSGPITALPADGRGTLVVDAQLGFRILLPPNWRSLRPGDEAFVTIYGNHDSYAETAMRKGTLRGYALPLQPRDADPYVTFSVYSEPRAAGDTPLGRAVAYGRNLPTGYANVRTGSVTLPAGEAGWMAADRDNVGHREFLIAYVLIRGTTVLYLDFVSSEWSRSEYGPIFRSIVDTLEYT
jgi:hypothetical protein